MARYIMLLETADDPDGEANQTLGTVMRMIAYKLQMKQTFPGYNAVEREGGNRLGRFRLIRDDDPDNSQNSN
jgi:hypothetical protein